MVEAVSSDKTGLRPQVIVVCHTPSFRPHNPLSVPPPACMYRAHMSAKGLKEGPCAFAPVWDANKDAPQCTHCNAKFGLLNSRHHCRNWYVQHMTRHVIARTLSTWLRPAYRLFRTPVHPLCEYVTRSPPSYACMCSGHIFCQACCYEKFRLPHIDDKRLVRVCLACYRELSETRRYGVGQGATPST